MATSVKVQKEDKNLLPEQQQKFIQDLDKGSIDKVGEALKVSDNLDQFLSQVKGITELKTTGEINSADAQKMRTSVLAINKSPKTSIQTFDPVAILNASDDDECTFHPKINNSKRLTKKGSEKPNESLYKSANEKMAKEKERIEAEKKMVKSQASASKISSNSLKMILQKLQQSLTNLISQVEDQESKGNLTFEGLGTVLHSLGVFKSLEFVKNNDGEKSSLSIDNVKAKPERLSREIVFHENFWKILGLTSQNPNLVSSELVLKFLITLVDEKTPLASCASLCQGIIDETLESIGIKPKEGQSTYLEMKEERKLWTVEKLVTEFRKLFDDKTSFMSTYASSNMLSNNSPSKLGDEYTFKPQTNKKSAKLDNRYFSETVLKKLAVKETDISEKDLKDRYKRLYKLNNYLTEKKTMNVEARIEEELAPCTFVPQTTPYKKKKPQGEKSPEKINSSASVSSLKKGYFEQSLAEKQDVQRHVLLYDAARAYKEKLEQKTYTLKKQEEMKELSECTFKPKITKKRETSPNVDNRGPPKGFNKAVERMNKAEQLRKERQAEKEKVPRGENYEKYKEADFKPPTFLERPKIKKADILFSVDVNIGGGKTGKISIHPGDTAKALAAKFAKTYSLNTRMRTSLEELLQSYIDNYLPKPKAQEDQGEDEEQEVEGGEEEQEGKGEDQDNQEEEQEDQEEGQEQEEKDGEESQEEEDDQGEGEQEDEGEEDEEN